MRTLLTAPLAVLFVGGLLFSGGCYKAELDEARAHNNNLESALQQANAAIQSLQRDKTALQAELAAAKAALDAANEKYALLEAAHRKLQADYDALASMGPSKDLIPVPVGGPALPDKMDRFLKNLADNSGGFFTYDAERGMLKMSSDLTFEKGSDAVKPEAKAALKKFIELFNIPEAAKYNVYIAGHTDDIPILPGGNTINRHPTNWYLSVHRAVSVQEELTKDGYAPEKIGAMGFGEFHPIAANAVGHKGNQANRRVELWILPPEKFLTLPMSGTAAAPEATPRAATPAAVPAAPAVRASARPAAAIVH